LQVTPTRSIYDFENDKVHVTLTFMRPALPDDLDAMALPLSYITWEVRSVDGKEHAVALYDSTSSQLVVNKTTKRWSGRARRPGIDRFARGDGRAAGAGFERRRSSHQLGLRLRRRRQRPGQSRHRRGQTLAQRVRRRGSFPAQDDARMPRAVKDEQPVLAFVFDLGQVAPPVTRQVIVAYDEIYAIKYFGRKLLPYWRRNGATAAQMLQKAARDYPPGPSLRGV
jgi:hypothetical protein